MAAETLGMIGAPAAHTIPAIITMLGDTENLVRWSAANALGEIGIPDVTVSALIDVLNDPNNPSRKMAAAALGKIGAAAASAVPMLIEMLNDPNIGTRAIAATALGEMGPAAVPALPSLFALLSDPNEILRERVTEVLGQIGPAAAETAARFLSGNGDQLPPLSDEDRRIVGWFEAKERIIDWIEWLQLFWCIGKLEEDAMMQGGDAFGPGKLERLFRRLQNENRMSKLIVAESAIKNVLEEMESFFNQPPFPDDAWSTEEKSAAFKMPAKRGNRVIKRWEPRARKAWRFVNIYLEYKGLVPIFELPDSG